ncbi:MAG: AtpZ/AtpI family protein [Candidatus Paceibacterota bacterium]|jgi:F0F1-type ATP synthase assembly protein I
MKQETKQSWWREPLMFSARMTGWVVVPVIIALVGGSFLDVKLGTQPWFFLVFTLFAFLISCLGITREVLRYNRRLINQALDEKRMKEEEEQKIIEEKNSKKKNDLNNRKYI